jgi:hypothetical protein
MAEGILYQEFLPLYINYNQDFKVFGNHQKFNFVQFDSRKLIRECGGQQQSSGLKMVPRCCQPCWCRLEGVGPQSQCLWILTNQKSLCYDITVVNNCGTLKGLRSCCLVTKVNGAAKEEEPAGSDGEDISGNWCIRKLADRSGPRGHSQYNRVKEIPFFTFSLCCSDPGSWRVAMGLCAGLPTFSSTSSS